MKTTRRRVQRSSVGMSQDPRNLKGREGGGKLGFGGRGGGVLFKVASKKRLLQWT